METKVGNSINSCWTNQYFMNSQGTQTLHRWPYLGRAMRERTFGHMRTTKVKISQNAQTDQDLYFALTELLDTTKYMNEAKARMILFAHAQDGLNGDCLHICKFISDNVHMNEFIYYIVSTQEAASKTKISDDQK